jgi:hypothetical protein
MLCLPRALHHLVSDRLLEQVRYINLRMIFELIALLYGNSYNNLCEGCYSENGG